MFFSDKRRVCELLALKRTAAVRMVWGTVQEPSSLHTLLTLFPRARLEEVRGGKCLGPLALI